MKLVALLPICFIIALGGKPRNELFPTKVRISEISIQSSGEGFIEIRRERPAVKPGRHSKTPLQNYKLLIVMCNPARIIMVVDLGNPVLNLGELEQFYTIGTDPQLSSIHLSSEAVQSVSTHALFPVEPNKSYLILLAAKQPGQGFGYIVMTKTAPDATPAKVLSEKLLKTLIDSVVDFFPLTLKSQVTSLEEFPVFAHHFAFPPHPFSVAENEKSWSYCGDKWSEQDFASYKLTPKTPGVANECSELVDRLPQAFEAACRIQESLGDTSTFKRQTEIRLRPVQFGKLAKFAETTMPTGDLDRCRDALGHHGEMLHRPWVTKWLFASIDANDKCSFSCLKCRQFFEIGFRPDLWKPSKRDKFAGAGFVGKTNAATASAVNEHHNSEVHMEAIKFFDSIDQETTCAAKMQVFREFEKKEQLSLKPTMAMMQLVYAEAKAETPFSSHTTYVDSLKAMGLNLGHHHFHDEAAKNMMNTIGDEFHRILLKSLTDANLPFTLVADASTDNTNNALLSLMIQTFENEHPIVYFYRLVRLNHGESAAGMFRTVMETVDEDNLLHPGFKDHFKRNLIALACDNAASMSSEGLSLYALLKEEVARPLFCSRCNAHKLELALQHAVDVKKHPTLQPYADMEKKFNRLYTYYMSRGSKKWDKLKSISDDVSQPIVRFKAYYHVRWASSHAEVLRSVRRNYYTVLPDLSSTSWEDHALLSTRSGAQVAEEMYLEFTDKSFPVLLNDMADAFQIFSKLSLDLETSTGTIIGRNDVFEEAITKLELLESSNGEFLAQFLSTCHCQGVCDKGKCNLQDYDICRSISCNDVRHDGPPTRLVSLKKSYYKSLITEMRSYFDENKLRATDIFIPQKYMINGRRPANLKEIKQFATDKKCDAFCSLLDFSQVDCTQFKLDFRSYLVKLFQRDSFNAFANEEDPVKMWIPLLHTDNDMTPVVKRTIRTIITIPSSSAVCERVFSHVTRIKNRERSSLKPQTLENLVRIKYNGPSIDDFDALYYAMKFVEKYVKVDDSHAGGGRPAMPEKFRGYFEDSRLF